MSKVTEKSTLIAEYETLKAAARANPTPENRDLMVKASAKLSAWIMANDPPKIKGYSTRAGKLQQARDRASRPAPRIKSK